MSENLIACTIYLKAEEWAKLCSTAAAQARSTSQFIRWHLLSTVLAPCKIGAEMWPAGTPPQLSPADEKRWNELKQTDRINSGRTNFADQFLREKGLL